MADQNRISAVFRDKTIFITGGSGFLGKVLLDKLLRCCGVKKVYLLVRDKKGKSPQERLEIIFDNLLFEPLKSEHPNFISKCQVIPGDITQDLLGISPEDRLRIQNEVDFIFHSAASTRFDDSVKTAVKFNTKSAKELLDLAEGCKKLKTLVHVSTAYAFPTEKVLYEKAYKPPDDPHKILDKVKFGKDEDIELLLGNSPNTYTFSKALAEGLVVERMKKIPAIIVRPSVVCPTWREPIKGWCNNLQGPMGLFVGAGKGIIRSMYMKGDSYADFIPADITINGMMVAVWNYLHHSKEDRILNLTASEDCYSWEQVIEMGKSVIYNKVPFNGAVWYPGGSIKRSRLVHNIHFYLFQLIPAIFLDALLIVLGYKPLLYQIQRRIQKGSEVFEYYTNKAWNFSSLKVAEIKTRMTEKEKECYKIDAEGFEVNDYLVQCILGVRRNNLKETDDMIDKAKRHMMIMWVVDVVVKFGFLFAVCYYMYTLVLKPFRLV